MRHACEVGWWMGDIVCQSFPKPCIHSDFFCFLFIDRASTMMDDEV
jgi:hypothetical protein